MNIQIHSVLFISLLGLDLMAKRILRRQSRPFKRIMQIYSVPHFSLGERSQNGGFIEAIILKQRNYYGVSRSTGADYDSELEGDIQDVFIKTMSFDEEKPAVVSDERSEYFFSTSSKKVTQLKESAVEQF